jgi:hypothetical protein
LSTTYQTIGQGLYDLLNGLDITSIYPGGWGQKANYPLKQPTAPFPAFAIQPVEDSEVSLENVSNDHTTTYAIDLYESFQDAATSEGKMRRLVDLVRLRLRTQWRDVTPFNGGAYAITELSGSWAYDIEHGFRQHRILITTKTYEDSNL